MPDVAPASQAASSRPGQLPLERLQSIWFQVTGLLCNLECTHCLVDSSPQNKSMEFLERATIGVYLREAEALGVKEIYFTGGEPFLHREMTDILEDALRVGPTTVLTNGTLITEPLAKSLGDLSRGSRYSLEIRVSMDHPDPEHNDAVRGPKAHERALRAVVRLQEAGLLPIVTATEYLLADGPTTKGERVYDTFLRVLREAGVGRPRLKVLPVFHTGKLEDPKEGGSITQDMLLGFDPQSLQCSQTRVITAKGVYACPILVGKRVALMSQEGLADALGPVNLAHHACRTCYDTGMTCGNV